MSQADKIAYQQPLGPNLQIEVDDTGNIRVAVRVTSSDGARTDTDGWTRSDVSSVQSADEALGDAQRFAAAVFPPHKRPALMPVYTWQERRDAYLALRTAGKLGFQKDGLARDVDLFLDEYKNAEKLADEGHREHMSMDKYVQEYERWW